MTRSCLVPEIFEISDFEVHTFYCNGGRPYRISADQKSDARLCNMSDISGNGN